MMLLQDLWMTHVAVGLVVCVAIPVAAHMVILCLERVMDFLTWSVAFQHQTALGRNVSNVGAAYYYRDYSRTKLRL